MNLSTTHSSTHTPTQVIPELILGSSSRYRRELLARLCLPFRCVSPDVDETPQPAETPLVLAQRLAFAKSQAIAALHPQAYVIGSDQVLDLNGEPLGKPHTHANAVAMLRRMSGQTMQFHSAVTVSLGARTASGVNTVRVTLKSLSDAQIERYLAIDAPYDCAGSLKSETLGIALCERIETDDPSSQIGLPLILTIELLSQLGFDVMQHAALPEPQKFAP